MSKSQLHERDGFTSGDLPEGWSAALLGELLSFNYGKALREDRRNGGSIVVYGSNGIVGRHDSSLTREPTIIVGRKGSVGEVHYSEKGCWPIDTTYFIDDFGELAPRYVFYALRFLRLSQQEKSSAIPGLSRDDAYERTLPIAPVLEQKRIVAKIDALLAGVDAVRQRVAKLPAILKRFRQSVLAAGCSGRLTADWRAKNPQPKSFAKKLADEDPPEHSENPDSWDWVRSADEFEFVTSGSRGWAKYYSDTGPIFLRIGNLNHDSIELDLRSVQRVTPPSNAEGSRTRVKRGDILISITADVGMIALVDADIGEAYINQHIALARPRGTLLGRYLAYYLAATTGGQKQFQGQQRGATKVGLGLDDIRVIWIAEPPLEEQREIVRRVESLFKLADAIEKRVALATSRAEKLTQSILAKAFRGELVPTEAELARREGRDYESASVLLKKTIREDRGSDQERKSSQRRVVHISAKSADKTVRA